MGIPDGNSGRVTWTVADTGIDIPAADRPHLLPHQPRVDRSGAPHSGAGLGLVITRAVIERHVGTITLADHAGPEPAFTIRLLVNAPTSTKSTGRT